jgi:hypothetical protein
MDIPNIFKNRTGAIQLSDLDDNFTAVKVSINSQETQIATLQQGQVALNNAINNFSAIPYGCIVMWSGSVATVPSGWRICDGTNGTPDLRDKFVVGAKSDSGGIATTTITGVDSKSGGYKDAVLVSHTHPVSSSTTIDQDTHSISGSFYASDSGMYAESGPFSNGGAAANVTFQDNFNSSTNSENRRINFSDTHVHTHNVNVSVTVQSQGDTGTNRNLPPYYSLAFIMKV